MSEKSLIKLMERRISNTWRLFRSRAKEIGLPEFKVARKTFMTISDELGISDSYGRALLGQNDPSISKFYKDMSKPPSQV